MAGDVTVGALQRLSYMPNSANRDGGQLIAGQDYYNVYFTGGLIKNVTLTNCTITLDAIDGTPIGANTPSTGAFTTLKANTFTIGTLGYTDTNVLASLQSSVNSYNQLVIQNSNAGATASSDLVVNNNLSTASTYYGDFGMNSSGFTGSGAFNAANAVYLTSTTADLAIGTTTANAIHFVVNNGATDAMQIGSTGLVGIGATPATYQFSVVQAGQNQVYFGSTGAYGSVVYIDTATSGQLAGIQLEDAGTGKWAILKGGTAGANFSITDQSASKYILFATTNGSLILGGAQNFTLSSTGALTIGALTTAGVVTTTAAGVISSIANTGTGNNVLSNSPTLVTPVLGVATATTINGLTLPALTDTVATLGATQTLTNKTLTSPTINGNSVTVPPIDKINIQTFSTSGTYTPTAGMVYCVIECWGGGGGGGGAAGATGNYGGGGGGGAGSYSRKTVTTATIGGSQTVTIGAAGSAGSAGNNNGGSGGQTSVGSICVANGGSGGNGTAGLSGQGGAGGAAGTGDINSVGQNGGAAVGMTTASQPPSGGGGSSLVGSGGLPTISGGGAVAGNAASGFASGGSGASVATTTSTAAGGAGTKGYVIITEFLSA